MLFLFVVKPFTEGDAKRGVRFARQGGLHDREGSREADISASRELFHYIVKAALMGGFGLR